MKKSPNTLTIFLLGALTMCCLLILMQCNKDKDPLFDEYKQSELEADIDYEEINKTFGNIEKHFKNADIESLTLMLADDSKQLYEEGQGNYSAEELETIAKALKKGKITFATEEYAELSYTIDDISYSIAIGQVEEGVWEIIRF